jgi:hypothetical protein
VGLPSEAHYRLYGPEPNPSGGPAYLVSFLQTLIMTHTTEGSNNATYKTKSDTYSLAAGKTVPRIRTIFPGRKPPSMIPT